MLKRTTAFAALLLIAHATWSMSISEEWVQQAACGAPTGSIDITVYGGTPPYTYQWSNGATTEDISGLLPGLYEVTVTDANSDQASRSWTIFEASLSTSFFWAGYAGCVGSTGGAVKVIESAIGGTPPYSYVPDPWYYDAPGYPVFVFPDTPPGTQVQVQVTDANGCSGTGSKLLFAAQWNSSPQMVVSNIQGACTGGSGGSVIISNIYNGDFWESPSYSLLDANGMAYSGDYQTPNTLTLPGLPPGDYHFVRTWNPLYMANSCDGNPFDRVDFTIPDLGPDCGSVSGTVYIDNDQDCVQDPSEPGVPFQILEILPGQNFAITGSDGQYVFDLQDGGYTLGQTDPTLIQLCPLAAPVPFTVAANQAVINFADSSTIPMDVSVQLSQTPMRPGFNGTLWGYARNNSAQLTGALTMTLNMDAALMYVDAIPAPTSTTGNTLVWELPALTAYQQRSFAVTVQVPVATPLGTALASTLLVTNTLPEANTANNSGTINTIVTGAYDPNVKEARTSTGYSDSQYFIDQDDHIDYTIHFQNTGTDTAFTVVVTDTLATELDMASFEQGIASHPFKVAFKSGRVVEWTFNNILLPDSNVNEGASHGLVSFRIKPKLPLLPGTAISNSANIYFDFNEPVITEPSVLVAEFSTGVAGTADAERIHLMPNPTDDILYVQLPEGVDRTCSVWSTDGRRVAVPFVRTGSTFRLDVHALAPGVYVLRMENRIARFVKN